MGNKLWLETKYASSFLDEHDFDLDMWYVCCGPKLGFIKQWFHDWKLLTYDSLVVESLTNSHHITASSCHLADTMTASMTPKPSCHFGPKFPSILANAVVEGAGLLKGWGASGWWNTWKERQLYDPWQMRKTTYWEVGQVGLLVVLWMLHLNLASAKLRHVDDSWIFYTVYTRNLPQTIWLRIKTSVPWWTSK